MKQLLFFILFPFVLLGQTQIGLDIDGEASFDNSGSSVSLSSDGSIVAVGAPRNDGSFNNSGHVRVYENIAGEWIQVGGDIDGEAASDLLGWSVSISFDGSIVAIGAPLNDANGSFSGQVRVYENIAGIWTKIGSDIDGDVAGAQLGWSVSISSDGSIVAIGVPINGSSSDSGHVRVYENVANTWIQIGSNIDGEAAADDFGTSVSISSDGSIVAIGAPFNDGSFVGSGHVRIYENIAGVWTQVGSDIDGKAIGDNSGKSVSLSSDGSIVAIGADNLSSGHVSVYKNIAGVWTQVGNDINGETVGDNSGRSVSISSDGSIVAIGAPLNDGAGNGSDSGQVRVYENTAGVWSQVGIDIDGELANDVSGGSVSISSDGSIVAIGAIGNNGNGSDSGHTRLYDLSSVLSDYSFVLTQFNLYPNPVIDKVVLENPNGLKLVNVEILDVNGRIIKEINLKGTSTNKEISLQGYSSGVYFVRINAINSSTIKRIIKQ